MTKEQIDSIIALGPVLIAATGTTVVSCMAVIKFFDFEKTKVIEKSVGLTKIMEFQKAHMQVLRDLEDLREEDEKLKETDKKQEQAINKLDDDYREMVKRFFDFYKGAYNIKP